MFLNKLRKYIESDECLIRHGKCVVINGVDDKFDLLEDDTKVDEGILTKIIRFINSQRKKHEEKKKQEEPPDPPNEQKEKTVDGEKRDDPNDIKDKNPPEGCGDKPKNEVYEKKKDAEQTGEKYEKTLGDEASEQKHSKAGARYDMPDIENEKIRNAMEKIRIFEEKVDKVRKMKFIKKY